MPSQTSSWPSGWPSFTPSDEDPNDTYQRDLKRSIIAEYGAEALRTAWAKTCADLTRITKDIATAGNKSIPVFSLPEALADNNENVRLRMKETGCFIIRNVIPIDEARTEFKELETFVDENKTSITGWPAGSPAIFHLYSTPTQLRLRTHPNHLRVQRLLNSLFTDHSLPVAKQDAQAEPVLYPDALRIRTPGQDFLGLGPHIDGGSLSRWADSSYRKTYSAIFSGTPEHYDPFSLTHRKDANLGMFPGGAQCSVLRTFQGWTALTPCEPGHGGLMIVPNIKAVTAYMMLRPFFKAPGTGDWKDGAVWEVDDESAWFPGTYRWDSQLLSPESHPHLGLKDTLLSIPAVEPGDTIWWHADMCHAVETTHNGSGPASVVYIPAAPSTPRNKAYIRQHWKDLIAGIPPEDYKYLDGSGSDLVLNPQNERNMVGALSLETISNEGRRALGEGV